MLEQDVCTTGVGLYPKGALINHSCTPNAMQSFTEQQVTFTALQPIAPGTEVTISYIELAATQAERRQQLLEQYYFDTDSSTEVEATFQCSYPPFALLPLPHEMLHTDKPFLDLGEEATANTWSGAPMESQVAPLEQQINAKAV